MTKFNYPIKRDEPGFEEAVKAIEPGDTVEVVIRDREYPPATLRGEAYPVGAYGVYLGADLELRGRQGVDPEGEIVELVSVEKPPPPPATIEELDALGRGSTIADGVDDIWVTDGEGTWICMAGAPDMTLETVCMVSTHGPVTIIARAES